MSGSAKKAKMTVDDRIMQAHNSTMTAIYHLESKLTKRIADIENGESGAKYKLFEMNHGWYICERLDDEWRYMRGIGTFSYAWQAKRKLRKMYGSEAIRQLKGAK